MRTVNDETKPTRSSLDTLRGNVQVSRRAGTGQPVSIPNRRSASNEDTSGESGPRCQSAQLFSLFSQDKRPVTIKKNVLKIDSLGKVAESLYKDELMACLPFQKDAAIVREIQLGSELNMQHNVCFYFFVYVCLFETPCHPSIQWLGEDNFPTDCFGNAVTELECHSTDCRHKCVVVVGKMLWSHCWQWRRMNWDEQ